MLIVKEILDTNLKGAILVCRESCRQLLRAPNGGSIINVGSVIASIGNTGQSVYGASKAGLQGFTRSLSRELGARNIRVNCVEPGFIDGGGMTDLLGQGQRDE